jgi:PilZ domain-containing protein
MLAPIASLSEVVIVTPQSGAASIPGSERRQEPRYSFQAEIEIEWGSSTITGQSQDISVGGMFIIPSTSLWIGARFAASLLINPPMKLECTVVRAEPGRGIGVKMILISDGAAEQLQQLLTNLETSQ